MRQPIDLNVFKPILGVSVVAALTASASALLINVPVWATFIGWIAFFSRGMTARDGVINLICVLIGLAMGIGSGLVSTELAPYTGALTITFVVLGATFVLMSVALLPVINNVLSYFLGLVCYFASNLPPALDAWITLGIAVSVGVLGGLLAMQAHSFFSQKPKNTADSLDQA
tara:strand:+ start:3026 stop:3541 length:516 start_codon:yes stop_codon:yes gene_type:complete